MSEKLIEPAAAALKELLNPESVKETHISYVFLTDEYVYKLKKPVDFGFLDFRLQKSRRSYCLLEKELNSRFSDDVYLDVLKLAKTGKDTLDLVPYTSTQFTVDHVVKMRRVAEDDFLETRIKDGRIGMAEMKEIGRQVANLFARIDTPMDQAEENGSFEVVSTNVNENFDQTEGFVGKYIDPDLYDFIKSKSLKFLEDNRSLFEARVADGYVKDGHGDLRLDHVYFSGDRIGLLDCIEFNRRFRFNDVICDTCFLAMELDNIGQVSLADAYVEGVLSVFDDEGSRQLLNFYRSYRAYVRFKVTCFLLEEKGPEWGGYAAVLNDAKRLADLSALYAAGMEDIPTLVFYGMIGTGKSKNANGFASRFPVASINTDETRKELAGITPDERRYVDLHTDIYSPEQTRAVYRTLGDFAEHKKTLGRITVIDGSFNKKDYMQWLVEGRDLSLWKVEFTAPESEILRRLEKRREKKTVSDGRVELYDSLKKSFENPGADLVIETTGSVEDNVAKIFSEFLKHEA